MNEKDINQDAQMILPKNELRISITSECNMKCVYCHNEGNQKSSKLTVDQICKIVEVAEEYGLTSVRLTGGEPLVHPEIIDICQILTMKYGLKVGINTNGILIDKLFSLINAGTLARVVVGIDYYDHIISKHSLVYVLEGNIYNVCIVSKSNISFNTLIAALSNCSINSTQVSNSDIRMILDNFLNGGQTTNSGTVMPL